MLTSTIVRFMRPQFHIASLFTLGSTSPSGDRDQSAGVAPPADRAVAIPAEPVAVSTQPNDHSDENASPQAHAVLAAMDELKQAIVASDTPRLARIWTDAYTFVNPHGALVPRTQRLANFVSGITRIDVIDGERETTVRVYAEMAVVQNLFMLRGRFSGVPTHTDLRGTFVWVRRLNHWRLLTNQLTPVR